MDETVLPGSIADVDPELAERFTDDSPTPPGLALPNSSKQRVQVKCVICGTLKDVSALAASITPYCIGCGRGRNKAKGEIAPVPYEKSIAFKYPELAELFCDDSPTPADQAAYSSPKGSRQRVKVKCIDCGEPKEVSAFAAVQSVSCARCRGRLNASGLRRAKGEYQVSSKPLRYEKSIAFKHPELAALFCDDSPTPPDQAAYSTQRGMSQRVKVLCSACGEPKEVSAYAAVMAKDAGCKSCQIPSAPLPTGSTASKGENELTDYVESLGHTVIRRDRTLLDGKELDIYLPELKLALEFNGDYWHSDEWLLSRGNITAEEYHRTKLELAAEKGVRLGFVWNSEWRFKWSRKPILEAVAEFLATDETPPSLLRLTSPSPRFASILPSDEPEPD